MSVPSPYPPFRKFLFLKEIAKLGPQDPLPIGLSGKILLTKELCGIFWGWKGIGEEKRVKKRERKEPVMGRITC
jgi:hypothetical protein